MNLCAGIPQVLNNARMIGPLSISEQPSLSCAAFSCSGFPESMFSHLDMSSSLPLPRDSGCPLAMASHKPRLYQPTLKCMAKFLDNSFLRSSENHWPHQMADQRGSPAHKLSPGSEPAETDSLDRHTNASNLVECRQRREGGRMELRGGK